MTIAEQGGPTTMGGASYQAWVAARWLAQLLLNVKSHEDPVIEVRLEGRTEVDDVEVTYVSGARLHLQAKRRIAVNTKPWVDFWKRARDFTASEERTAMLVVGEGDERWDGLVTAIARAREARDAADFEKGTKGVVKDAVQDVAAALGEPGIQAVMEVLARTRLERATEHRLRTRVSECLPLGSATADTIATALAEIAAANAMSRRIFSAVTLRRELALRSLNLEGPRASLVAYLDAMERAWGTVGVSDYASASAKTAFVWPTLEHPVRNTPSDRFSEYRVPRGAKAEDARTLLEEDGRGTLIVAGSGFGKSTLLEGLARHALSSERVPIIVSLPVYAATSQPSQPSLPGLLTWVEQDIQRRFSVDAAWAGLAARGQICMLFDGLDEVPRDSRGAVLTRVRDFASRYPRVPWIIATRDTGAVSIQLDVTERTLGPIEEDDLEQFFTGYVGESVARQLVRRLLARGVLTELVVLPLFATMLAGYVSHHGVDNLPLGPSGLLGDFVENALSQKREGVQLVRQPGDLQAAAGQLAYAGVKAERQLWSASEARRDLAGVAEPDVVLEDLRRAGLLLQIDRTWRFVLPIVQEYLAGTHLAQVEPQRIAHAMLDQATRPWAQTAQFALVEISTPDDAIMTVLHKPDDVFGTILTAIGRAVAWGARVTDPLRVEIGERLATLYLSNQIVAALDLHNTLEAAYSDSPPAPILAYLREYGFGSSLTDHLAVAAPNDVLLEALKRTLDSKVGLSWIFSSLTQRLVTLGEPVLKLIEARARLTSTMNFGSVELLRHFATDPRYQSGLLARHEVDPLPTRAAVAVYVAAGRTEDAVEGMVALMEDHEHPEVPEELWAHGVQECVLDRVMASPSVSAETRGRLIWSAVAQKEQRIDRWLQDRLKTDVGPGVRAQILASWACLRDDVISFLDLCKMVPEGDLTTWMCMVICLGKFEQEEGVEALESLADLNLSVSERRELAVYLRFPMTHTTRPWGLDGSAEGIRERVHPGIAAARRLAQPLAKSEDEDQFARFEDLTFAATYGVPEAIDALPEAIEYCIRLIRASAAPNDDEWRFDRALDLAMKAAAWKAEHELFLVNLVTGHDGWNVLGSVIEKLHFLRNRSLEELLTWSNLRQENGFEEISYLREAIRDAAIRERLRVVEESDGRLHAEAWDA